MKSDVIIIGGGVAGLAAGALLAKRGVRAVVLEKGNQPGGRAYAYKEKGFTLNYGPHGMYRPYSGVLGRVMRKLGHDNLPCEFPDAKRSYWSDGGRFASLGSKPLDVMTTKLFPLRSRLNVARAMLAFRSAKVDQIDAEMTFGEWVDAKTRDPLVRSFMIAFGTVNTYTRPAAALSARFLVGHVQRHIFEKDYVGYMNGGWGTMTDAFIDELHASGGQLVTGARVDHLEIADGRITAAIVDGERYEADAFVLTLPPQDAPDIAQHGSELAAELARWSGLQDVRALCMDLGFSRRVRSDGTSFIFDIERDLYYSLHSEVTPDLAPDGGQLLHAMAYLSPEESASERLLDERKAQLVAGLDRWFAGWREAIAVERTIPNVRVASARRTPEQ